MDFANAKSPCHALVTDRMRRKFPTPRHFQDSARGELKEACDDVLVHEGLVLSKEGRHLGGARRILGRLLCIDHGFQWESPRGTRTEPGPAWSLRVVNWYVPGASSSVITAFPRWSKQRGCGILQRLRC